MVLLHDTTDTRKHNGMESRQKNTRRNVCPIVGRESQHY